MNKYLLIILLSFLFTQHFNVEISDTGESTLFIFSEEINNLSIGDEIAIFDLPKPLLPQKNREGTNPNETTRGFNTLEIDPETGRPILDKEKKE